jgi:O-antigen/teichoic acid export membrane protein
MTDSEPREWPDSDLTRKASKSVFWVLTGNVGVSAIRFVGTMILARILLPHEFGIVGMSILYYGIVTLFGKLGMGHALIQRLEIDQEYLSTGFWTTMIIGVSLSIAGIACSPLAATFFREPAVRGAIAVLSVNFTVSSFGAIPAAILTRELRFRTQSIIEISTTVARVIFIVVAALHGLGYWSIILGLVLDRFLKTVALVLTVRWMPSWCFDKEKFNHLFKFGRSFYGHSFLEYLSNNMDYIVTGRVLGAANLAYYQFAFNLPHLALSHVSESVNQASYPILSKVQEDKVRVARGYLKTARFVSLVTFPLMMGLFFVAYDFIHTVYGERWLPSVLPLKILCFSGALRSVFFINDSLVKSQGRPDLGFKWGLVYLPLTCAALIVGSRWELAGIATAMLVMAVVFIAYVYIGLRLIHCSMLHYLANLVPALVCSALMVAVLVALSQIPFLDALDPWWRLGINTLVGAGAYLIIVRLIYRNILGEFMEFARGVFKRG